MHVLSQRSGECEELIGEVHVSLDKNQKQIETRYDEKICMPSRNVELEVFIGAMLK